MKKKNICILVVFCVLLTLFGVGCQMLFAPEAPGSARSNKSNEFVKYSINDARRILNAGGQIYQNLRVYSLTEGVKTYRVPVPQSEIMGLLDIHERNALRSVSCNGSYKLYP